MAEYSPSDPVDAREIARRLATLGAEYSQQYIAGGLARTDGFPEPESYELNGGRWWKWGAIHDWFVHTGRLTA